MMRRPWMAPAIVWGGLIVIAAMWTGPVLGATSIYRGFYSLQLGMSVAQFIETTPAVEVGQTEDERIFSITRVLDDHFGVTATFTDDQLSRIEVIYSADYSSRVSWDEFVATATRKYGAGFHLPTPGGDVDMWDDGRTTLILERRAVTDDAHAYTLTLLDDHVVFKRQEQCAPRFEV